MRLHTRPPTGVPAYPLVLVEGQEKAGKSYCAYQLSASPRVGRTFVADLGDGSADEYAALGPYEVLELDGTFPTLVGQLEAAAAEPSDGKPNVIVVDSGTDLWGVICAWADKRARDSKAGRRKLADDPDAEIDISMNLWNDAANRWTRVVQILRRFPGVGVITAQGKEVSKVDGGRPVPGQSEYRVEAHKSLPATVNAWVRLERPHRATLVGARSLTLEVPAKGLPLPDQNVLDHVVFEMLGAGGFAESEIRQSTVGLSRGEAKARLLDAVKLNRGLSGDAAQADALRLWSDANLDACGDELPVEALADVLALVAS